MGLEDEMKARMEGAKKIQQEIISKRRAAQSAARPGSRPGSIITPGAASIHGNVNGPLSTAASFSKIIAEYTVKKGDTLSQIAKDHYGSGSQPYWKLIQEANKDIIKDANLIYPGQVFKIPVLPEVLKKK